VTAESSIGRLKRFSPDGELLSIIGRARIGGGCKHVSIGHDESRNRFYVQYEDANHICVMLPNAEAAPLLAEEDRMREEAEAEVNQLAGTWTWDKKAKAKEKPEGWIGSRFYGLEFDAFTFEKGRGLQLRFADPKEAKERGDDGFRRWFADGKTSGGSIRLEIEESDGYVDFVMEITRIGDDTIRIDYADERKVFRRK
jgi:hypothetical protein